jgi:hypothetical protein
VSSYHCPGITSKRCAKVLVSSLQPSIFARPKMPWNPLTRPVGWTLDSGGAFRGSCRATSRRWRLAPPLLTTCQSAPPESPHNGSVPALPTEPVIPGRTTTMSRTGYFATETPESAVRRHCRWRGSCSALSPRNVSRRARSPTVSSYSTCAPCPLRLARCFYGSSTGGGSSASGLHHVARRPASARPIGSRCAATPVGGGLGTVCAIWVSGNDMTQLRKRADCRYVRTLSRVPTCGEMTRSPLSGAGSLPTRRLSVRASETRESVPRLLLSRLHSAHGT